MADSREEFLRNYATELDYLRRAGAEFAGRYPKVAQRLGMSDAGSSDPHTLRLIESFAFLTAKLQRRIDAELPELSASLLGLLYPHFTSPIPTMAIGSFELDPALGLAEPVRVPAGAQMFARAESGEDAYFRVSYPMTLWPIDTSDGSQSRCWTYQPMSSGYAVIRIGLEAHDATFADLNVDSLRFYIHGDSLAANQVLEAVLPEHYASQCAIHVGAYECCLMGVYERLASLTMKQYCRRLDTACQAIACYRSTSLFRNNSDLWRSRIWAACATTRCASCSF